jgi:anti-sigma-K factor RskA
MNLNELHAKLIAAARKNPPASHVPYAFEKRIMSHLAARPAPDLWALWGGPLWRAALSCVAITVLCGLWSFAAHRAAVDAGNFSQDFDAAVFAPLNEHLEEAW